LRRSRSCCPCAGIPAAPAATSSDRKIADIDRRIAALAVMRRTLAGIAAACPGDGPTSDCPILAALDTEEI